MPKIVITGGNGFIGTNLQQMLVDHSPYHINIMELPFGDIQSFAQCRLDILPSHVDILPSHAVVHLAAIPGIPNCKKDPHIAFNTNVSGTRNILGVLQYQNSGKIIFASSGAAEESMSIYGATKRAAEEMIKGYYNDFGLECYILRFSNVYGPHSAHKTSFVTQMMKAATSDKPLIVHGDGSQERDFIYVQDVCEAIVEAIKSPAVHCNPINIASGNRCSITELINIFLQVSKSTLKVCYKAEESPGVKFPPSVSLCDYHRDGIMHEITSLESGLEKTWHWYQEHWE